MAVISHKNVGIFLVSLFAFILALTFMKEGASSIAPELEAVFDLQGTAHSLGFGWLSAYVLLSGSPVAAAALTFFQSGTIEETSAFAMIIGSRVGAAFIVLAIGLYYVFRGRDRASSLGIGLLALVVTAATYFPALPIGLLLLRVGALDWASFPEGGVPYKIVDKVFDPIAGVFLDILPPWATFLVGMGLIVLSLNLFDRALPTLDDDGGKRSRMRKMIRRPYVMFFLGAVATLITLSVSISLSILVPLGQHRIVKRDYVVPYIMGANITTLVDTVFAALVLDNPDALQVVLADTAGIAIVSVIVLAVAYRPFEKAMLGVVSWATDSRRNLAILLGAFAVAPLVLLIV